MVKRWRQTAYDLLERSDRLQRAGKLVDLALILLISINVAAVILESVEQAHRDYGPWFHLIEVVSVGVFTVEYLVRLWCAPEREPGEPAAAQRLAYARTPLAVIDFLAIAPFYMSFIVPMDLRFLRVLRLLRVFKLTRYSGAMSMLLEVFRQEANAFFAGFFILMVLLILAASGAYLAEHQAQPDKFGSIPHAMWWAMVTLTTVGYGDVTPITTMGRLFGAVVTIIGIGMAALPAGILASGMADHLRRRRQALADRYRHALEDGEIDPQEEAQLEALRKELGLSKLLADEVLADLQEDERADAVRFCPHCGVELKSQH
jgi:voltage-gated potassium channel